MATTRACRWAGELAAALTRASEVAAEQRALHDASSRGVLRGARVIGCTTTGAALFRELLREAGVAPGVVMVEEAGELLEAHVLTSLSEHTKHLIMVRGRSALRLIFGLVECLPAGFPGGGGPSSLLMWVSYYSCGMTFKDELVMQHPPLR